MSDGDRVNASVRRLVLLAALIASTSSTADEPDPHEWSEVRERRGVIVRERALAFDYAPNGEETIQSSASVLIDATVLEVLAVLQDDAARSAWMANCDEARLLEPRSRWNRLTYTRLSVWPFTSRDVVVETQVSIGAHAHSANLTMKNVDSALQPPIDGIIRMPSLRGQFLLESVEGGTRVEFQLAMELGGHVPDSLARYARRTIPLESMENLRALVPATRANYAQLVRDWQRELGG